MRGGCSSEAWITPTACRQGRSRRSVPKALRLHPEWVRYTDSGAVLDPSGAAVRQYIADGVEELCRSHPLDGIHFDDYFYPCAGP